MPTCESGETQDEHGTSLSNRVSVNTAGRVRQIPAGHGGSEIVFGDNLNLLPASEARPGRSMLNLRTRTSFVSRQLGARGTPRFIVRRSVSHSGCRGRSPGLLPCALDGGDSIIEVGTPKILSNLFKALDGRVHRHRLQDTL